MGDDLEFYQRHDIATYALGVLFFVLIFCVSFMKKRSEQRKSTPLVACLLLAGYFGYACVLVGALLNGEDWLRNSLKAFYPDLSKRHVESQFDTACDFRGNFVEDLANGNFLLFLWNNVEGYVLSHFFGWWIITALFLRDFCGAFALSLVHELLELWWERFYPPFRECWWDHYILDLGCNFFGCLLGYITFRLLGLKPLRLTTWDSLKSPLGRLTLTTMVIEETIRFPLIFFLPHVLGIPPKHIVNVFRFLVGKVVLVNLTAWTVRNRIDDDSNYFFSARWDRVHTSILLLELLVVIKFFDGKFLEGANYTVDVFGFIFRGDDPLFAFHTHLIFYLMLIGVFWLFCTKLYRSTADPEPSAGLVGDFISVWWVNPKPEGKSKASSKKKTN